MPQPGGYLLDTNILLALIRLNNLGQYLDATYGLSTNRHKLAMPFVVVGEVLALAEKFAWGPAKKTRAATVLSQYPALEIGLPSILQAYADIGAATEAAGRPMGQNDLWIAATAHALDATLLTTDKDFNHLQGAWIDREWVDPTSKLPP